MKDKIIHFVVGDISVIGGVEKVTLLLAEEFIQLGASIQIHSLYTYPGTTISQQVNINHYGLTPPDRKKGLLAKISLFFLNGLRLNLTLKPSISEGFVIFQGFYLASYITFFPFNKKRFLVCEHNSYQAPGKLSQICRIALYRLYKPKVIVLTEADKKHFQSWGILDISKIFNPLPELSFYNRSPKKTLIAIGRFTRQKRFDLMIEICSPILERHPDWCLKIQGDGEEKSRIQAAISKSGVGTQIELIPLGNPQSLYEEGSIFLMTSAFEGMPLTILESMSLSIPVIAFNCSPGMSEVISQNIDGYLVPMDDLKGFSLNLEELITNDVRRNQMGIAGRESSRRFKKEVIMDSWTKVLQ